MSAAVTCIVPAYNAAATLTAVVQGLREALPGARVVTIDDGSTDRTRRVAADMCDRVIAFDENRGKGAALRAGFADALAQDARCVLTVDADGQHDPAHAPALVAGLAHADIVIGARARAGAMPIQRRLSNALSTLAVNWLARCDVADSQSGYRAIAAHVLREVRPDGDRYEFETDLLIRAGRAGFRIACLPVATIYGQGPSHFRAVHDTARVVRTLWRHRTGT